MRHRAELPAILGVAASGQLKDEPPPRPGKSDPPTLFHRMPIS